MTERDALRPASRSRGVEDIREVIAIDLGIRDGCRGACVVHGIESSVKRLAAANALEHNQLGCRAGRCELAAQ